MTRYDTPPNDLVRRALDFEPGSPTWVWALTTALKIAVPGPGRGRPGNHPNHDSDAWWVMWEIHRLTGETRPYTLAREALATGRIPRNEIMTDEASAIRGLVRAWERISADGLLAWVDENATWMGLGKATP